MSKQPRRSREAVRRAKTTLILPEDRSPLQLWLLIRQEPADNRPGCFFVTHGRNFDKFEKRPGFSVLAHSYDRAALTLAARKATLDCGPQFQPPFSAHRKVAEKDPSTEEVQPPALGPITKH